MCKMNKHTHTNKRRLTEIFFEIGVRVNKKNNKIKKEVRCHSDKKTLIGLITQKIL